MGVYGDQKGVCDDPLLKNTALSHLALLQVLLLPKIAGGNGKPPDETGPPPPGAPINVLRLKSPSTMMLLPVAVAAPRHIYLSSTIDW